MLQPEKGVRMQGDLGTIFCDSGLRFQKNWIGHLPEAATRDTLRSLMAPVILKQGMNALETEQFLDLLERYEGEYHETPDGHFYHRKCGGGAMVRGTLGVYCANCGKLPSLLPAVFI
jgi:hypothetical protein